MLVDKVNEDTGTSNDTGTSKDTGTSNNNGTSKDTGTIDHTSDAYVNLSSFQEWCQSWRKQGQGVNRKWKNIDEEKPTECATLSD